MSSWSGVQHCVICETARVLVPGNRTCDAFRCRSEYQHWLQSRKPVCAICGKRIPMATSAHPVCGDSDCSMRWVALSRAGDMNALGRCKFCGVFTIRQADQQCLCRDPGCLVQQSLAYREEQQRIAQEKFQAMLAEAEKLRDRMAGEFPDGSRAGHRIAVIPHTSAEMASTNPESVASFRQNLAELTRTAFTEPAQDSDWTYRIEELPELATATELPVFGQACSACRGKCCRQGGNHAFLAVSTIRRYIRQHPEATAEQVVNSYMEHLPTRTLEDSCVFHTDRGCNLPREMRADMCNHYICRGLQTVRSDIRDNSPGFFIVSEEKGEIVESRFVDVPGSGPE